MRKHTKISIAAFIIISLVVVKSFAQELANENTLLINQYFQLTNDSSKENNLSTDNITNKNYNVVILNQAGINNTINVRGTTNDSQIVNQVGENNSYEFLNYYNNSPSSFNILQQGNSNSLQIYGENSIIKNIGIVQRGNFKSLIIKNY